MTVKDDVFVFLRERDGASATVSELAEKLGNSSAAINNAVKELVGTGWLHRSEGKRNILYYYDRERAVAEAQEFDPENPPEAERKPRETLKVRLAAIKARTDISAEEKAALYEAEIERVDKQEPPAVDPVDAAEKKIKRINDSLTVLASSKAKLEERLAKNKATVADLRAALKEAQAELRKAMANHERASG